MHFKFRISEWYNTYCFTTVNALYEDLVTEVTAFYDNVVKSTRPKPVRKGQRWFTDSRLKPLHDRVLFLAEQYKTHKTADTLNIFLKASREFRELKEQVYNQHWEQFLQGINHATSSSQMWNRIKKISHPSSRQLDHHSPVDYTDMLLQQYASTASISSLPLDVQHHLASTKINRNVNIKIACSEIGPDDNYGITPFEIKNALKKGKTTSPGEDGITYNTMRVLAELPNSPLLELFNQSLRQGVLPDRWTQGLIIPIPKPNSQKFRPISLTSCMCKVLERIILAD